jgi:hypothetical protein
MGIGRQALGLDLGFLGMRSGPHAHAVMDWRLRHEILRSRVSIRRAWGMQNCKVGSRPACAWTVGNRKSPRQGTNMVTDPCENIVRKHGYQSRAPGTETSITAIMARKAAIMARKIMASAPAVIVLVRKLPINQPTDHVADRLVPLDRAQLQALPSNGGASASTALDEIVAVAVSRKN